MAVTLAAAGYDTLTAVAKLLVDGNNVMGSRPDGWWRDRHGAMQRLVNQLDDLEDEIVVVFDGRDVGLQATRVAVFFAAHADDEIAARAGPGVVVVTSDRELRDRALAAGADVVGARALLERLS